MINSVTGETHAYLLSVVPEPKTYALVLTGLAVLWLSMGRRKGTTDTGADLRQSTP